MTVSVQAHNSRVLPDSQSLESGFHGDQGRESTRTFSILQMWRELEDEYMASCSHARARPRLLAHNGSGLTTHPVGSVMCRSQESEGVTLEDSSESEDGDGSASDAHMGPQSEHEDRQSITSEQSHDLGEIERERVRKIFQEWMNNGVTGLTPNGTSRNSSAKAQWLGEREIERVGVVREWIQMTSQQGDVHGRHTEEHSGEIGMQIERVRDGLVLDHNQGPIESPSRGSLRFCGRQTLLDLLAKRSQEVQIELKVLMECRAVSSFPFRNRIQSSLRVRFLLNKPPIKDERPNSAAESELGLLRQRSTVSDLREGFLSKLRYTFEVRANDLLDSLSDCYSDSYKDDTQADCSTEDCGGSHDQPGSVNHETYIGDLPCCTVGSAGSTPEERNLGGSVVISGGTRLEHAFDNVPSHLSDSPHGSANNGSAYFGDGVHSSDAHTDISQGFDFFDHHECSASPLLIYTFDPGHSVAEERNLLASFDVQAETVLGHASDSNERNEDEPADDMMETGNMQEEIRLEHDFGTGERNRFALNCDELASSDGEGRSQMFYHSRCEDGESSRFVGANVVIPDSDLDNEEHDLRFISYHSGNFHGSASEQVLDQTSPTLFEDRREQVTGDGKSTSGSSVPSNVWENVAEEEIDWRVQDWQGQVTEDVERVSEDNVLSSVWGNDSREEVDEINLGGTDHEMLHDNLADEPGNHLPASSWHMDTSMAETTGDRREVASVERDEAGYYSDDDNTYHMELRELLSRRRVSSLLHSGFGERLNRLIQSYVERQSQSANDWDQQELPLHLDMQNQGQTRIHQNEEPGTIDAFSFIQQPYTIGGHHQQWDQLLNNSTWSRHDIAHGAGAAEVEMINDLRMDMARLQQRLNTMQRMLDTCLDMQIELQRAVRQEVSAVLNRSTRSSGPDWDPLVEDGSNWDHVRKGVCCLCCDAKIDSLLYRCGHMCTCTECASMLVVGNGKCPMCRAPVLEAIRAYVIQ